METKLVIPEIAIRIIIVNQTDPNSLCDKGFVPLAEIWRRCLPEIIGEESHRLSRELYAPIVPTIIIVPRFRAAGELLKTATNEFARNYIVFVSREMYDVARHFKEGFEGLKVVVFTGNAGLGVKKDENHIILVSRYPKR